jgi:hypothetical protein
MNTNTYFDIAASKRRRSSAKAISRNLFGGAAVACLVLGCGSIIYTNIFAAGPYPQLGNANFDAPVVRRSQSVATKIAPAIDSARVAQLEASPLISAPITLPPGPSLSFLDRFAASAPKGVEPKPQPELPKFAEVSKPVVAPKLAETPKTKNAAPSQIALNLPPPVAPQPQATEAKPAKPSLRDMAQRAKAAILSIASNEKQSITEKLWGKEPARGSLLSYASADASVTGSIGGREQNPMLGGIAPYDRDTAVYDITAHTVYLPDGTKLEAHSGLGSNLDDPRSSRVRMRGVTPPHIYTLKPRESLFHGVAALRLTPIGGEDAIYGRDGLLAHTFMLGPNGDSNGCVSFRDYNAFLNAYRNQGIRKLAVLARVD